VRLCDEAAWGFGWIQEEWLARSSHAVRAEGRVWVVDPVDAPGVDERIGALGEPAGVIQLVDRHRRDCAAFADRLGVPHHVVPFQGVPGAPFDPTPIARHRLWREVALWWPEERVLLCGDVLGTVGYFVARDEKLGVHPLLRLAPPRALSRFAPEHVLCGHGQGVHGEGAAPALDEALATARRRLPAAVLSVFQEGPAKRPS
jgi:hypothetical protein